ncbi:MAG: diacylglycerol kinase family lipid kinase [Candidatus Cloacimonetes bacterium]|nr:diacylglycerol kinase family lipid kinase [Candidatus Cloacimonadota bacterium]
MKNNQKYLIIINLTAGRGKSQKKLSELIIALKNHRISYELRQTKAPKHAIEITRKAISEGFRKIIAVGGDGTINEVMNGIMLSGKNEEVTLGIIPEGGGNDFAKNFQIRTNIEKAIETLLTNKTKYVDVGKIEDQYFINSLGIGFDAIVAQKATRIKFLNGLPRYLVAVFTALINLKFHKWEIITENRKISAKFLLILFGNGKYSGGGFKLTPNALVNDGLLNICLVRKIPHLKILKFLPLVIKGEHIDKKEAEILQSNKIEVISNTKIPIYFDGELPILNNDKHLVIELIPKQIRLIIG